MYRPPHHLLGMTQTVDGCGVDPVDTPLDRIEHAVDRRGIVLRTPSKRPASTTRGPCSEANGSQVQIGIAETPSR